MLVVHIHDTGRFGVMFGSCLSRATAIRLRAMSGDLLLDEDFQIDLGDDWLFDWEKNDPKSYVRRKQQERLSCKGYYWYSPSGRQHGR